MSLVWQYSIPIVTARRPSCGKLMLLHLSPSVHRGLVPYPTAPDPTLGPETPWHQSPPPETRFPLEGTWDQTRSDIMPSPPPPPGNAKAGDTHPT